MPGLRAQLVVCGALLAVLTRGASAADIVIGDGKAQPESLTVAPGGVLIVGSASSPFVYRVRPGATTAAGTPRRARAAGRPSRRGASECGPPARSRGPRHRTPRRRRRAVP